MKLPKKQEKMTTYGITGVSGKLGRLVVNALKEQVPAEDIVGLVRTPQKAQDLGIKLREFNYSKPEQLVKGLEGVDKLLLISSSEVGKRTAQHKNVVEAAKKAGVKLLVYTSLLHADKSTSILAEEHNETEEAIKQSGLNYVILRNGWYTENYTDQVPQSVKNHQLIGSAQTGKISSAARSDFADAAVRALTQENPAQSIYELAGDDYYTLSDLANEISRQVGFDIPYVDLPEAEYASRLAAAGLPANFASAIASFDTSAAADDLFDDTRELSRLIGHPTIPLSRSIADVLN